MSETIVDFNRLSRNFGAKQALNEVTLSVERGSVIWAGWRKRRWQDDANSAMRLACSRPSRVL